MIILIQKSELFKVDPDVRFAREYSVDKGLWKEMWRRHKLLEYSIKDICDYYEVKTKRQISRQNIKRWVLRTEIYSRVKPVADMGCESLNSNYFGDLEWFVIKELLKNIKTSVKGNVKTLP